MGLFGWFKNLFGKSVHGSKSGRELVYLATKKHIKIGTNIDVNQNYAGIVVAKGVVCDVFSDGRHRLEPKEMPLASRKLKLTKQNKKGKLPEKFRADIYIINLNGFEGKFRSKFFVKASGDGFKNQKANLCGEFSYKIVNPIDFLEAQLTQFGIITDKMAQNEIADWVASLSVKAVQKNKPSLKELYTLSPNCVEGVKEFLNKELYDCGIRIENFEIKKAEFTKKMEKTLSTYYYLQQSNMPENPVEYAYQMDKKREMEKVYNVEADKIEQQMSTSTYTIDSNGKNQIETGMLQKINQENQNQTTFETIENDLNTPQLDYAHKKQDDFVKQDVFEKQNENDFESNSFEEYDNKTEDNFSNYEEKTENYEHKNFENDNLNTNKAPIQKTINFKKCPHCNSLNSVDSKICFKCGENI